MDVLSAGIASEADTPLDDELVRWADRVFVMEDRHRTAIRRQFRALLGSTPIVCLGIPDRYRFMDPQLVDLLERKVARFVG
ncbi:phosphotyrosine protein phosphatase [Qipengyuania sp. SS22]|uniref:phosphotyrosine protein phosphatase n=1 Tax=Qipengyuania sp. SS22 TaxID=2979461 RepID=UPI0021E533F8|nr:phosphotyrosine protein phosphatase [Qipengyuania sp. SS22]UYH55128.1 phosphotyrosine protein phosphatase [Qipengyuania sp. SS22]